MADKQLPKGWHIVKFGEMAKHISKRIEPRETDLNIYVGLEHLDSDSLRIRRNGVPSDVEGQKLLVKKGQIIFGKRRAYQRKLGVAEMDCICSAHAMVLEANPETVMRDFLPYFMLSDVFMNRAVAISEGSLSPTIKWKILAEQNFAIPNLDKQIAICKILNACEKALRTNEDLLESSIALLNKLFESELLELNGKRINLSGICDVISGQHIPSDDYSADSNGTPYLTGPDDFPNGSIQISKYTKNPKVMCKKGDILLTVKGSGVGKCVVSDGNYCISRQLTAIRSRNLPSFVVYLLVRAVSQHLNALASGVIPGITKRDIEDFQVADLQSKNIDLLTNVFQNIMNSQELLREKISHLTQLRSSIFNPNI